MHEKFRKGIKKCGQQSAFGHDRCADHSLPASSFRQFLHTSFPL